MSFPAKVRNFISRVESKIGMCQILLVHYRGLAFQSHAKPKPLCLLADKREALPDELIRRIRIPLLREDAELLVGLIRCFHLPMGSAER